MLNLSEQWKEAYASYIEEQENIDADLEMLCEDLAEAQMELTNSYKIVNQYMTQTLTEKLEDDRGNEAGEGTTAASDPIKSLMGSLVDLTNKAPADGAYTPTMSVVTTSIKDMKFPQNLIFFIKQIIAWIRNIVIFFIEKFKNILRRFVGAKPVEFDYNKLKLDLKRAKSVEQVAKSVDLGGSSNNVISAYRMNAGDVALLEGDQSFAQWLGITKEPKEEPIKTQPIVITLDLSRDLMNLRELTDHFYSLYDTAYGSNNENLFAGDDLKVILELFKDTIDKIKSGNLDRYSIGGNAVEATPISSAKVKQNLILTNTNINKLKEAYMTTAAKIKDITKIISSKEIMMLSDMGVDFRLLTSSTYNQLKDMLDTMPSRMNEAKKMEKDLTKMQSKYNKMVDELKKMQRTMQSVSTVEYDTVYNRRIIDLFNAASWMSQTVTLRLTGLSLYIKELKDVRDALLMVANLNAGKGKEKKYYKF